MSILLPQLAVIVLWRHIGAPVAISVEADAKLIIQPTAAITAFRHFLFPRSIRQRLQAGEGSQRLSGATGGGNRDVGSHSPLWEGGIAPRTRPR